LTSGYIVRPRADIDLDEIAEYLTQQSSLDIGLNFLAEAQRTFALLKTQPAMGWQCKFERSRLAGVRMFRVRAPFDDYLIFYQPRGERVEILRVLHGRQDLANAFSQQDISPEVDKS
jgi:toxin ParE1/3/4